MSTELAVKEYAVLQRADSIAEVVRTNLGASLLSLKDLTKITVPAAGALQWSVPSFKGDISTPNILGVLVNIQETRSFWRGAYTGEGNRPDCFSSDAVQGSGDPGGSCVSCEFAQWKSASVGKGQACKLKYTLFMVRGLDLLPVAIILPPTSVGPVRTYLAQLTQEGIPYYGVVTSLSLSQDKSSNGIKYSKADPRFVEQLDPEHTAKMATYSTELKELLQRQPLVEDDA